MTHPYRYSKISQLNKTYSNKNIHGGIKRFYLIGVKPSDVPSNVTSAKYTMMSCL